MKIGVVGIPLRDKPLFPNHAPFYEPKITDAARKMVKGAIDFGELKSATAKKGAPVNAFAMADFARQLFSLRKKCDLLVVFGESHAAAYPLYFFPGKVSRFDLHGDAFRGMRLNSTSYVRHAIGNGIKQEADITNYGILGKNAFLATAGGIGNANKPQRCDVLDIDVDVLDKKYKIMAEKRMAIGNGKQLPAENVYAAAKTKPKIVGFFEYVPSEDKKKFGTKFFNETVKAAV
ncbi:Uncharacterised protein [Candidatus Norongarragalina meridionalis]|nr:Uncharacterised protein [Candidatus Norongarragalina meridionalis]